MRIALLGTGLIGGSIGLAAVRRGDEVAGFDPSHQAVSAALDRGALTRGCRSIAEALQGAEIAVAAAPVAALPALLEYALQGLGKDCVLTDVGSTKRALVAGIHDPRFVGGHPLAGAETAGVANARAELFDGASWYLTPGPEVPGPLLQRLERWITGLGAHPLRIDATTHDRVLAATSHLPHVLANVLLGQAAATLADAGQDAAGEASRTPSFRDATRVAGASSAIWTDIYLDNRDALLAEIDGALARLTRAREVIAGGSAEAITRWNEEAAEARRDLGGTGP